MSYTQIMVVATAIIFATALFSCAPAAVLYCGIHNAQSCK